MTEIFQATEQQLHMEYLRACYFCRKGRKGEYPFRYMRVQSQSLIQALFSFVQVLQ